MQIRNEMHTGGWWWDTQSRLLDGATVVPLLLSSDKTQLTLHNGDRAAWPIYMSIGNLNRETRRRQGSSALVLLGFIPILKEYEEYVKSEVYHTALGKILKRE